MPMLEWRPDIERTHMFRMPFKVGGMKDLQLHTPIKSKKKKVWANVYQKLSFLPSDLYMKNIEFGFIPKFQEDKHRIVWIDRQVQIPMTNIIGLAFKGTAITYTEWIKTYNPYDKYNNFIIDILRNNKRVQTSLPSLMQGYRNSGVWEEIRSVKKDIWDVATADTLKDMWYYLSGGNQTFSFNKFTIPNPITSLRILLHEQPQFNFVLSKDTMKRHTLQKHISSPPKPLSQRESAETIRRDFDEQYEQYISDGSDNNPHTLGWDRDPILLEEMTDEDRQADMDSQPDMGSQPDIISGNSF